MSACLNCGTPVAPGCPPTPTHCGDCPPWRCDDCGETCSMETPCGCWISLDQMPLADIKALFASGAPDLTLGHRRDQR